MKSSSYWHDPEKYKKIEKDKRINDPVKYSADRRRRHINNPALKMLIDARRRAKKQNVPFSISIEDIKIPTHCPWLGIPIFVGTVKSRDNSPSLDRLKPELGYIKGNVIVISYRANSIKYNASWKEIMLVSKGLKKALKE